MSRRFGKTRTAAPCSPARAGILRLGSAAFGGRPLALERHDDDRGRPRGDRVGKEGPRASAVDLQAERARARYLLQSLARDDQVSAPRQLGTRAVLDAP